MFAATLYARILSHPEVDGLIERSVFAREENHDQCQVIAETLITAKARVTPTKTESVSRLELTALE